MKFCESGAPLPLRVSWESKGFMWRRGRSSSTTALTIWYCTATRTRIVTCGGMTCTYSCAQTQTQTKPSMQSSARRGWEPVAFVGANDAKQSLARTLSRVFVCVSTMSCLTLVLNWPAIASNGQQTRLGPGPAMRLNFPKRSITPILPVVTQSMQNGIYVFLSTSLAMTLGICQARSHYQAAQVYATTSIFAASCAACAAGGGCASSSTSSETWRSSPSCRGWTCAPSRARLRHSIRKRV